MTLFRLFLFSLVSAAVKASQPTVAADLGLYHNVGMHGDSRLLLNPLSIFGNPQCDYKEETGACYGEVECLALAGNYGNFCPGLQGLCCLFYRTCGQRTSQEVSYFRNVQYPLEDRAPAECGYQIIKRSDEFCGIRVTMLKADLPPKSGGTCDDAYFLVTGIHNDNLKPKCGGLTGSQYSYSIANVDEIFLHIKSPRSSTFSWNMKVIQVKCSEWQGEDFEDPESLVTPGGGSPGEGAATGGSGGGSTGGGSGGSTGGTTGGSGNKPKPVFPPTHAPPIVGPPAPPTTSRPITTTSTSPLIGGGGGSSFLRCGVRGPSFGQGTRGSRRRVFYGLLGPAIGEIEGRRRKNTNNRKRPSPAIVDRVITKVEKRPGGIRPAQPIVSGSIGSGAAIISLEWRGPQLNDTLFAHYLGEPPTFPTRITYGSVAGTKEFPWQIAMTVNGKFHCGASLISDTHVLTAAHCVILYKNTPSRIDLSLGDWDLSTSNDGPNIKGKASRITVHPNYSRSTLQNDLAVVKLTQKVEFTERIQPICLPTTDLHLEGERATVSGWGRNEDKKLQAQLHQLEANVVQNSDCDKRWNSNGAARGFIVSSMMCMDSTSGDSCNGDSGGPSIYESPAGSGIYVQVGIVSFGSGSCTDPSLPGVYTRVSHYRDWIKQQMI